MLNMKNKSFLRCLKSLSKRSPQLEQLLHNEGLLDELNEAAYELHRRENNKSSFVLRGKLQVHNKDLHRAIRAAVEHLVDDDAASSIYDVVRLTADLVLVKCDSTHQRQRITSYRKAFSRIDTTAHRSPLVRQVLLTKLHVDDYCTRAQLRVRGSQWQLFHQLKGNDEYPNFEGEVLYHRPGGAERHTPYAAITSTKQQAAVPAAVVQEHAAKPVPQGAQQQQPVVEQVVAQAAAALAIQQPVLRHAEPPHQPRETASATQASGPSARPAEQEASAAPAAETPPVAAVTALATRTEAHNQRHQPLKKLSTTHPAVNPATHRITRPPLETLRITISNTPAKSSSTTRPKANPHSGRPVWGAHSGPYKPSTAWRMPDMLPNGTHNFR
jgi:hypothetical protein